MMQWVPGLLSPNLTPALRWIYGPQAAAVPRHCSRLRRMLAKPAQAEITMSTTNGGPAPQSGAAQTPVPQIGVLMQYVKDFSFENPNAPRALTPSPQQPSIKINIGVEAAPLTESDVEVTLRL